MSSHNTSESTFAFCMSNNHLQWTVLLFEFLPLKAIAFSEAKATWTRPRTQKGQQRSLLWGPSICLTFCGIYTLNPKWAPIFWIIFFSIKWFRSTPERRGRSLGSRYRWVFIRLTEWPRSTCGTDIHSWIPTVRPPFLRGVMGKIFQDMGPHLGWYMEICGSNTWIYRTVSGYTFFGI